MCPSYFADIKFNSDFKKSRANTGLFDLFRKKSTQKEISGQTDWYLVILSAKTYVFEDKLTKN